MKVSGQLTVDLTNFSSYDNIRKIASLVDGFKNASRKIYWTVFDKNITQEVKVSRLDSTFQEYTEYLHGSATNVIVGLAQDFTGSNNLPLLAKSGSFGTRFIQEASAPRYIYTYKSKKSDSLFNKEDSAVLEEQYFEGAKIEPKFMLPTLPLLLINGSEGVSSGFAQKILPRSLENMKKAVKLRLKNKEVPDDLFVPYYEGFTGTIEQGDNPKQWVIKGKINKISIAKLEIVEVPIGYDLKSYIDVLDDLEESGVIKSYKDMSENDAFKFVIQADSKFIQQSEEVILDKLKLSKKITENFTCIDENNKIVVYNTAKEVFEHYYKVKLQYTGKRKEHLIESLDRDMRINASKYVFIKSIVDGAIQVNNKTKDSIIEQIQSVPRILKVDDSYDYLLRMPLYSLTTEKMEEIKTQTIKTKAELETTKEKSLESMWADDLGAIK